jgi:hypothetical protein
MVNTTETWNNDLSNKEERDLYDSDFEVEQDREETPFLYSPFSPYYNENLNK